MESNLIALSIGSVMESCALNKLLKITRTDIVGVPTSASGELLSNSNFETFLFLLVHYKLYLHLLMCFSHAFFQLLFFDSLKCKCVQFRPVSIVIVRMNPVVCFLACLVCLSHCRSVQHGCIESR
jgi:hypothetical protein